MTDKFNVTSSHHNYDADKKFDWEVVSNDAERGWNSKKWVLDDVYVVLMYINVCADEAYLHLNMKKESSIC